MISTSCFPSRLRRAGISALALAAACAGVATQPAPARAGTFQVSQCNPVGVAGGPLGFDSGGYWFESVMSSGCLGDGQGMAIDTGAHRVPAGGHARFWLQLPLGMSSTTITRAELAYSAPAQSPSVAEAYLAVYGPTRLFEVDMSAGLNNPRASFAVPSARELQFDVWCSDGGGPGYCNWPGPVWTMKGLTLTLAESVDPEGEATGTLLSGGPQSGTRSVVMSLSDADSGVDAIELKLGSTVVHSSSATCAADRLRPCPQSLERVADVDTTRVADGSHPLRLVVTDRAGNARTVDLGRVDVDNVPPPVNTTEPSIQGEQRLNRTLTGSAGHWSGGSLSFAYRWERYESAGWEPIAGATASHHLTTAADVGKRLRFRVTATNAEGSTTAYSDHTEAITAPGPTDADGDFDGDGIPNQVDSDDDGDKVLDVDDTAPFDPAVGTPARGEGGGVPGYETPNGKGADPSAELAMVFAGTRSRSMRMRYGSTRRVTGTLLDGRGRPISGAVLDVSSRTLSAGAAARPAGTVTTDSWGRFSYTLPKGPSRRVTVSYRWLRESSRYTHTTTVRVDVVPRVSLNTRPRAVRNGRVTRFSGSVAGAPRGARKVVELQARVGTSWRTFAAPRLTPGGRFSHSYRFTRTRRPTTYRFRALVRSESGWPFLTGQSRTARVSVRP